MASEMFCGNFGDSARVNPAWERARRGHVFDGGGEHACHSDSESLGSRKSRRYVNAAICVEPVEAAQSAVSLRAPSSVDLTPHPHGSCRSASTPQLADQLSAGSSSSSVRRKSCMLGDFAHPPDDDTPRVGRTYREDGDTFRLSVASVSTSTTAKEERERNERKRREAFRAWLARKEREKREKAEKEKSKMRMAPAPTLEQREESYRRWLEEKERRRAEEIMRRFREAEHRDQERQQRDRLRDEKLADWIRKKEEEIKVMKTREERAAARADIERQRRRAAGERAYREWLRASRGRPLPVPLNQGELSMRGSVSEMYINPIPWQST